MEIVFLKKIRLGSASWTDLGSVRTQTGVKMGSKHDQKIRSVFDRSSGAGDVEGVRGDA